MQKKSKLIFAQIDHISGDMLGFAMEKVMDLGAKNVQLIPTITKKNRPGNVMIIDVDDQKEEVMSEFLAKELNVSGYHRIDTQHVFHNISFAKKNLTIRANGIIQKTSCEFKRMGDSLNPVSVSIEHDFLVEIQKLLLDKSNHYMPINELRKIIESKLRDPEDEITIEL
jgi:uncharacterized protein (DUF111 family)